MFHNSYHILYAVKTKVSVKNSENSSELFKLTETRFPVQRDLGGEGGKGVITFTLFDYSSFTNSPTSVLPV